MHHPTALYKAVKRGDAIEIRRLLSSGADPNEPPDLRAPLCVAAARGNTLLIRILLNAGAKPDGYAVCYQIRSVRVLAASTTGPR